MLYIGIDPDLHTPAAAAVDGDGRLVGVHVYSSKGKKGREAVVAMLTSLLMTDWHVKTYQTGLYADGGAICVEGQELYRGTGNGDTKNARDIVFLAAAAGGLISFYHFWFPDLAIYHPAPGEWKGNVPKYVNQARTYKAMGWDHAKRTNYAVPQGGSRDYPILPLVSDWKHAGDALGMALWVRERHTKNIERKAWVDGQR